MCEPATIIASVSAALALGSGVTSAIGASQQASRYNAYQQQQAQMQESVRQRNAALANQQARLQQEADLARFAEEQDANAQQKLATSQEARQARATTLTTAGEANVSGLSVEALLADVYRQEANNFSTLDNNLLFKRNQLSRSLEASTIRAENTANSVGSYIPQFQPGPSLIGSTLSIGANTLNAGLSGYQAGKQLFPNSGS